PRWSRVVFLIGSTIFIFHGSAHDRRRSCWPVVRRCSGWGSGGFKGRGPGAARRARRGDFCAEAGPASTAPFFWVASAHSGCIIGTRGPNTGPPIPKEHEQPQRPPKGPLCEEHRARSLFLVRMRLLQEPAVLRRLPQGHGLRPGQGRARRDEDRRLVRLQAHEERGLL